MTLLVRAFRCRLPFTAVVVAMAMFVGLVFQYDWQQYKHFGLLGFDTGIFSQGTWLLSRFHNPFVTIRGLDLFGDHASYILLLAVPFYWVWPDPRMLLLLQAIALAAPAYAIFKVGERKIGAVGGMVVALAYLIYPAMNWAAVWQFHPETFAAAFLAFAWLSYDTKHDRRMLCLLGLALLCKEDVSLVVAGFGGVVWMNGRRKMGLTIIGIAIAYFVVVVFLITPLVVGYSNLYFQRNYGVGHGIASAIPSIESRALWNVLHEPGLLYLTLIFLPMSLFPLLGGRMLLPIAGPLLLNIASNVEYQRSIKYQYLATSSPFIAFATLAGIVVLTKAGFKLPRILSLLAFTSVLMALVYGPLGPALNTERRYDAGWDADRRAAIRQIPKSASVAVPSSMDTQLSNRKVIYELPNPFVGYAWGLDDKPDTWRVDQLAYVIVDERDADFAPKLAHEMIKQNPAWEQVFRQGSVTVYKHR